MGDHEVADGKPHDEGDAQRHDECRVLRPVPDREPHLHGAERGHDPSQQHQLLLEAARVLARAWYAHPRSPGRYTRSRIGPGPHPIPTDMFDTLTESLDGVFKKLRQRGKLHPKQVDNALADIRTALLEADVAVEVADDLLARVRARALSEEVLRSLTPRSRS